MKKMNISVNRQFIKCKKQVATILQDVEDDDPSDSIWNAIVDLQRQQIAACNFIEDFLNGVHLS